MTKFRKKPVVIDAIQWSGDILDIEEMMNFFGDHPVGFQGNKLAIFTLEGTMEATAGDWIIRGVKGELYPCKPDIFEATYEAVE